jgi:hypothetical protein
MSRTLAAFLAERPEEELQEMQSGVQEARQRLRQEEERLKVEEALISDALGRKSRRVAPSGGGNGRVRLTRGQVLRAIIDHPRPVTTGEIIKLVHRSHPDATDTSIRAHVARLQGDGKITQNGRHWSIDSSEAQAWGGSGELSEPQEIPVDGSNFPGKTVVGSTSANGHDPAAEDRETGLR